MLVLDVGHRPPPTALAGNLYDLRKAPGLGVDLFQSLIGTRFESLHNVFFKYTIPKLKSPGLRFVTHRADEFAAADADDIEYVASFAAGGMANAWGAAFYPFHDEDFAGFPIGLGDIQPYYDAITAKIGICGADDDLARFFGAPRDLLPPVALGTSGRTILRRYTRRRAALNRQGLYVGRSRLAVLTREHDGRPAYQYDALEFFRPTDASVYNPAHTLDEMVTQRQIRYQPGFIVEKYVDDGNGVTVYGRDCDTGAAHTLTCRRLILAAGTINTSKIVLSSNADYTTQLPLFDTPMTYVPMVDPRQIGGALDKRVYSAAMLSAFYAGKEATPIQLTLYPVIGTLRSDYVFEFPLSVRGNVAAAKYLTPAMLIVQLCYPATRPSIHLRLRPDDRLELRRIASPEIGAERDVLRLFRQLGYFGSIAFCRHLAAGSSYRYAGTLPMAAQPTGRYTTSRDGLLAGTRAVYVADAATLQPLPAKNHSFTMMANAMRIADHVGRTLA